MSVAEGGLVEVYQADARHKENLEQAMRVLREGGVTPFVMDRPNPAVLHVTQGIYGVRIGVPEKEAGTAAEIIAEWNDSSADIVERQTGFVARDFALSFPAAVAAAVVTGLVGGWGNLARVATFGGGAWFLAFLVVSNIPGLHDGAGKKPPRAVGPEEEDG